MKVFVAPMQGHTEGVFCKAHCEVYSGVDSYFTPFIRVEKGEPRRRDMRNIDRVFLVQTPVVPQAIFRDIDEWRLIADAVGEAGYDELDLNLGCPFTPQVKHGRGAALLRNRRLLEQLSDEMRGRPDMHFSLKMRLGVEAPDEWRDIIDIVNEMPLCRVTVHPRVAVQQYGGELFVDEFTSIYEALQHPVVYNGDILTPEAIDDIVARYPRLHGVMAGRGVMARPSLFAEWRDGREWSRDERIFRLLQLHDKVYSHYSETLCGDTQILMKIKPFWEYLEPEIGHKAMKSIRKATSVSKYEEALNGVS